MARSARKVWFEVVWSYRGQAYVYGPFATEAQARREFGHGKARIQQQIHGGALRVDEVAIAPSRDRSRTTSRSRIGKGWRR